VREGCKPKISTRRKRRNPDHRVCPTCRSQRASCRSTTGPSIAARWTWAVLSARLGGDPVFVQLNRPGIGDCLKGATSRFDKSDRDNPELSKSCSPCGTGEEWHHSTRRARGRAEAAHSRFEWKTARRCGTRGPGHRASRLAGSVRAGERPKGSVGDWDLKVYPALRSLIVVMLDEPPQYPIEMSLTADEQPVEALGPGCPCEPFGERVSPGATASESG
jgi:hypothetical protein